MVILLQDELLCSATVVIFLWTQSTLPMGYVQIPFTYQDKCNV